MNVNISEGVALLSPEARKIEIPYAVVWFRMGAIFHCPYKGREDSVGLELDGEFVELSRKDWADVARISDEIDNVRAGIMLSGRELMRWHRMASDLVKRQDKDVDKSVVMLKDRSGSGYWRMVMPAKHLEKTSDGTSDGTFNVTIDVTSSEVKFDSLLEYDTIFVQRLHDWESYYILERLKEAGKRIVYDIDDDIFSLTPDNPAFHVIGRDNQIAARECMKLADVVTTTTEVMAQRMTQVTDGEVSPVVIPNAMNPEGWIPTDLIGSPDNWQRIFWQGSATHDADWEICIEAIDAIMAERDNVRLVILGYLPKAIQARAALPHWQGKIEYMGFSDTETYFQIIKHLKADVGLAPLESTPFNEAKSPIKWMENALIGMPTVASFTLPYSDVIDDGVNGRLVSSPAEWKCAIEWYLDNKKDRIEAVRKSRQKVSKDLDIRKVAEQWRAVLT